MLNDILDDQLDFNSGELDTKTITEINLLKIDANQCVKQIKEGRNALILLSFLTMLGSIISMVRGSEFGNSSEIIIEGIILVTIYAVCAAFVKKNPRASLLTAFIIYILIILLSALVDPSTIISGILIKGLVIYFLLKGINAAFNLKKIIQKLRRLGISDKELKYLKNLEIILKTKRVSRPDDIL